MFIPQKIHTEIETVPTGGVRIRTWAQNVDGRYSEAVDVHLDRATLDRVISGHACFEAVAAFHADGTACVTASLEGECEQ